MHTSALTDAPRVRRLVLVPESGRSDALVRRYRLARRRVDDRAPRGVTHPDAAHSRRT